MHEMPARPLELALDGLGLVTMVQRVPFHRSTSVEVLPVEDAPTAKQFVATNQRGYVIGETESPIVPILTGDEARTIALWQQLLGEGLYVNVIVPPGCPVDECVLRVSCSAAHSADQITRALDIFEHVNAEFTANGLRGTDQRLLMNG